MYFHFLKNCTKQKCIYFVFSNNMQNGNAFPFWKNGTKNSLQNGNTFMFCENTQRKYVSTRDIFAKKIT